MGSVSDVAFGSCLGIFGVQGSVAEFFVTKVMQILGNLCDDGCFCFLYPEIILPPRL